MLSYFVPFDSAGNIMYISDAAKLLFHMKPLDCSVFKIMLDQLKKGYLCKSSGLVE